MSEDKLAWNELPLELDLKYMRVSNNCSADSIENSLNLYNAVYIFEWKMLFLDIVILPIILYPPIKDSGIDVAVCAIHQLYPIFFKFDTLLVAQRGITATILLYGYLKY